MVHHKAVAFIPNGQRPKSSSYWLNLVFLQDASAATSSLPKLRRSLTESRRRISALLVELLRSEVSRLKTLFFWCTINGQCIHTKQQISLVEIKACNLPLSGLAFGQQSTLWNRSVTVAAVDYRRRLLESPQWRAVIGGFCRPNSLSFIAPLDRDQQLGFRIRSD